MKFARFVFIGAGIWGLAVLLPLYGLMTTLILFYASGRISALDAQPAWPDGLLGVLFIVAFVVTRPQVSHGHVSAARSNDRSSPGDAAARS